MTRSSLPEVLGPAAESRFPHRARALFGFFAAAGRSLDELGSALTDWSQQRSTREQHPGELLGVGVRMEGTESDLQDSIGTSVGETIASLDGFATVDVETEGPGPHEFDVLFTRLEGVGERLAGIIDPERSFATAGLVNLVRGEWAPYALILMCTHHPEVDLVDAHSWWCSFGEVMHAAGQGHTLGYHQVQCDPELSWRAARAAGVSTTSFDMGDLVYLRSVDDFVAAARAQGRSTVDPGPPVNQRDDFISFRGSVGAFCSIRGV